MAGDIKRQRKSWTLQDRSKVSINILRANLAEEGDEDAQLDVAKRLLQENSDPEASDKTQNENARLALYWLIKSSEQGNDEATHLLRECLQSGRGLTAQNILDVRTCVTTPKDEKLTFKAARLLHRKLSNGEEFITTSQLLARMSTAKKNVTFEAGSGFIHEELFPDEDNTEEQQPDTETREDSTDTGESPSPADEEKNIVKNIDLNETFTVASNLQQPASSTSCRPPKQEARSFVQSQIFGEKQSALLFAMTQPGKKLTLSDLLNVAKDFNLGRIPQLSVDESKRILGRHQWNSSSFPNVFTIQLLILAVAGNVMQLRDALTCLLFISTVWSSYNLLLWKLRYENFKDWRSTFQSVLKEGSWNTLQVEMRLVQRYLLPYLITISISSFLVSFTSDFPNSLPTLGIIVMISIQFGVLHRILPTWQQCGLLSVALLYFKCPLITTVLGENIAEQTHFLRHPMVSTGGYLPCLSLSLNGFSIFVIVILLTTVKSSLLRLFSETFPELVCTWWLLKVTNTFLAVQNGEPLSPYVCAALLITGLMALMSSKLKTWKLLLVMVTSILLITTFGLIFNAYRENTNETKGFTPEKEVLFLEWEDYDSTCHRKAWNTHSPAATHIKCSTLYGDHALPTFVKWKGKISIVKVEKLSRSTDDSTIQDVVFDISVGILASLKDDGSRNWQSFLPVLNDGETLAPAAILLKTEELHDKNEKQYLIDHVLNFRSGDKIEFFGKLRGTTAGSLRPQIIEVQSLQCLSCAVADYGEFIVNSRGNSKLDWVQSTLRTQIDNSSLSFLYSGLKEFLLSLYSSLSSI